MYNKSNTRKRTHLKPSQVAVLQESFMVNTLPDSAIRTRLATELDVSERTVQIWFQNRRAKARKSDGLEPNVRTGWLDLPVTKPAVRCITKRARSSSKPERPVWIPQRELQPRAMSEGMGSLAYMALENKEREGASFGSTADPLISIPASTLRIGHWARFVHPIDASHPYDLSCFGDSHQLIWQVQDGPNEFRIHTAYDHIQHIRFASLQLDLGQLEIERRAGTLPFFAMKRSPSDWIPCGDFTEHKQATASAIHILQGPPHLLKSAVLHWITRVPSLATKLVFLDDFLPDLSPSLTPELILFDPIPWTLKDGLPNSSDQPPWLLPFEDNLLHFS
ncbi:hypothetical protein G6F46_012288 [Rhizopus delemar]|uniref:Homeobox domain-containing protein n=3 Tax=Rhizopus TaxID=4842 RepID=I1CJ72_RHIO9|nr:hypothetical protein RO3G_13213 [Rhizopus delemar RA 99-880]KAG1447519.1 hypothetical protein G6F55_011068 [Rhizopus delemar]KAG1535150.1 hypothetical protein G6F51_011692 [Rhizopus arrhizus]KAG1488292.1 hypothetical protein G6F54_012150 [Rhizopus delemar]KAG1497281.1 hypothetical protein G6F53_012004 [Rhizopus delemar]|eukprot:EIE88502.1 hypothetical protein RO3G_13213 [Rhizopus delemar RA 99-880]